MTMPAGVVDDDRDEAQVSPLAHRGVYYDLSGYPADHEGNQTTVTERHSQRRTFESRHRNLVENRLVCSDPELRHKLKAWAASQEPRVDGFGAVNTLPCHRLAQLKQARQLRWQRHMAQEEDAEAAPPCDLQDFQDLAQDLGTMR